MRQTLKNLRRAGLGVALAGALVPAHASLVGYWSFNEGSGATVADGSGQGNNGTLLNQVPGTWVAGVSGIALSFSGVTGAGSTRVQIPDSASLDLTTALTFAAWVKPGSTTRDAPIIAKEGPNNGGLAYLFGDFTNGGFGALLDTNGSQPWSTDDSYRRVSSVALNAWTFVAVTWDGSTVKYYKDGAFVTSKPFSGTLNNSGQPLVIGANAGYLTTAFQGAVDEVRIYNNALTAGQIDTLYHLPAVPEPETYAMVLAGLAVVARAVKRKGSRALA